MKIFNLPINSTSFGNISISILFELFKRDNSEILINNIGAPSLDSFDKIRSDETFINWLNQKGGNFLERYSRDFDTFKLWHINGSETSISNRQVLYTFLEVDGITNTERNILNNQDAVVISNDYTKSILEDGGVTTNIVKIPLGFDDKHFVKTDDRKKIPEDICSFLVAGKFEESRKRHTKTIRAWIKKYGNNPKYLLNLAIYNPFLSPEDNNKVLMMILEGNQKPFNVNVHPFYPTLSEYNQLINFVDIVLVMGNEAWDMPGFTAACLGKHIVAHNCAGIKEWANEYNATLVESNGKFPCYDNMFFREGQPFNQGNFYDFSSDDLLDKIDIAHKKWESNRNNFEGERLKDIFSYKNMVDKILEL